jgi:hypothetical protein
MLAYPSFGLGGLPSHGGYSTAFDTPHKLYFKLFSGKFHANIEKLTTLYDSKFFYVAASFI